MERAARVSDTMSSAMADADNYTRWIVDCFRPYIGSSLIEIGIGAGNYIEHFGALESYTGVDIDAEAIETASRAFPERRYVQADLGDEAFVSIVGSELFDTVLCANVLEHIEDDRLAVENLIQVLKPGGHMLLFVPAFACLYTDLDRMAGHLRRYSCAGLIETLPRSGGSVIKIEYFNPIGALGWWAQKFMPHSSLDDRGVNVQIRFFDKYILPISRLCNTVTRQLFGQSVICVVRKES